MSPSFVIPQRVSSTLGAVNGAGSFQFRGIAFPKPFGAPLAPLGQTYSVVSARVAEKPKPKISALPPSVWSGTKPKRQAFPGRISVIGPDAVPYGVAPEVFPAVGYSSEDCPYHGLTGFKVVLGDDDEGKKNPLRIVCMKCAHEPWGVDED